MKQEEIELTGTFKEIEEHTYTEDKCFLCGCLLTTENRTEEHVIPKWLLNHFQLWNEKITLLNGSLFSYKYLTVPCCFDCNNLYLQPFEDRVLAAFRTGYEGFQNLDPETLFLWLGKIYYGIVYKEMFLRADITNPGSGSIADPEYLKSFNAHFLFLQGIRKRHVFKDFFPATIYIFKTQKPKDIAEQWDFIDNHLKLFISIRMGEIGIICALQDCEATQPLANELDHHRDIDLHPLQFREMTTKILYKVLLMNRTPKFLSVQNGDLIETHLTSLQGFSDLPIFDDWDNDTYSKLLSEITGVPLKLCQPERGKVWTWLMNEDGKSNFIKVNS